MDEKYVAIYQYCELSCFFRHRYTKENSVKSAIASLRAFQLFLMNENVLKQKDIDDIEIVLTHAYRSENFTFRASEIRRLLRYRKPDACVITALAFFFKETNQQRQYRPSFEETIRRYEYS